jgi:hypothetical protein
MNKTTARTSLPKRTFILQIWGNSLGYRAWIVFTKMSGFNMASGKRFLRKAVPNRILGLPLPALQSE